MSCPRPITFQRENKSCGIDILNPGSWKASTASLQLSLNQPSLPRLLRELFPRGWRISPRLIVFYLISNTISDKPRLRLSTSLCCREYFRQQEFLASYGYCFPRYPTESGSTDRDWDSTRFLPLSILFSLFSADIFSHPLVVNAFFADNITRIFSDNVISLVAASFQSHLRFLQI